MVIVMLVTTMVVTSLKEPQQCNDYNSCNDQQKFDATVSPSAEFVNDNLTACHVDKCTASYTHKNSVNEETWLVKVHADDYSDWCWDREQTQAKDDLLESEASSGEGSTERNCSSSFVNQASISELTGLFGCGHETESDSFKEFVDSDGDAKDNSVDGTDRVFFGKLVRLIGLNLFKGVHCWGSSNWHFCSFGLLFRNRF
jgi:hypothetical protein